MAFRRDPVAATLLAVALAMPALAADKTAVPTTERAQAIATERCVPCHTAMPTVVGLYSAPDGVVLEQPAQLKRHAERIGQRVASGAMPPANVTGLTDAERAELLAWARAARKSR